MRTVLECWQPVASRHADPVVLRIVGDHHRRRAEGPPTRWRTRRVSAKSGALAACVHEAVRPALDDEGPTTSFYIVLRRSRADAPLPEPDPTRIVHTVPGVGCWQQPPGRCPSNPRAGLPCDTPPPQPTRCGDEVMRSDTQWHVGLARAPTGESVVFDTRLLAGDGTVLWKTALPNSVGEAIGAELGSVDGSSAPVAAALTRVHVAAEANAEGMMAVWSGGLLSVGRRTGTLRAVWAAPPPSKPPLHDAGYSYTVRVGKQTCRGGSRGTPLLTTCEGKLLFFDGSTLAVFDEHSHALVGARALEPTHVSKAKRRERKGVDEAKLRVGGVQLTIDVAPQEARRR